MELTLVRLPQKRSRNILRQNAINTKLDLGGLHLKTTLRALQLVVLTLLV